MLATSRWGVKHCTSVRLNDEVFVRRLYRFGVPAYKDWKALARYVVPISGRRSLAIDPHECSLKKDFARNVLKEGYMYSTRVEQRTWGDCS